MENREGKINKKRIENYEKFMSKVMIVKKYDLMQKMKDYLEESLDMNLRNHKITGEEYDILNDSLQELLQKHFEIDVDSISKIKCNPKEQKEGEER